MSSTLVPTRDHALAIWQAAVAAVRPEDLIRAALANPDLPLMQALAKAHRILVVGAGKAGAAMSAGLEQALAPYLDRLHGIVNVPTDAVRPLQAIRLHQARPAGRNEPTPQAVEGTQQIMQLLAGAGPEDVAVCLISGGGSALLPAPVAGVTLEDLQRMTHLLLACGASINEMNAVRKHLSLSQGGGLARAFRGHALFGLVISDVVGDPLDVIASGPTSVDPTTFADALAVLQNYDLTGRAPPSIRDYLARGAVGQAPETLKVLPTNIHNLILGNNVRALAAAGVQARKLGFSLLNLGSFIEGETRQVAQVISGLVRSIQVQGLPLAPPVCLLSGGETTVTLPPDHGMGGRNQEFVLSMMSYQGPAAMKNVIVLSGGTDGEDGPTDAAGALADASTWRKAEQQQLSPGPFLARSDAYHFFAATGDLLRTGLTHTNVMDVRVILIGD